MDTRTFGTIFECLIDHLTTPLKGIIQMRDDLKKDSTVTVTTNQVTNKKITFATTQGASAAIDTSLKTNTTFQSGLITTDRQRVELQKSLTSQLKESANETENFGNKSASALECECKASSEGIKNTANEFQGVLQSHRRTCRDRRHRQSTL